MNSEAKLEQFVKEFIEISQAEKEKALKNRDRQNLFWNDKMAGECEAYMNCCRKLIKLAEKYVDIDLTQAKIYSAIADVASSKHKLESVYDKVYCDELATAVWQECLAAKIKEKEQAR